MSLTQTQSISNQNKPYRPYGVARDLLYCREPEILMEGPAGTGKTRALLEKANLCAMKYPGMRALFVRKTRESSTESVLVTLEEKVLPTGWPMLSGPSRRQRQNYRYPNGSIFVIAGMDRASRIMSTEYDMIFVFEARELTEDDWESLLTRLRNGMMPYQQAIADTNPDAPTHWLNQRALRGQMTRLLSRHDDNPNVTNEYKKRLNHLTGVRRDRLYKGIWAGQEGAVYDLWDPAVHLVNHSDIPLEYRRIRSIDFGYTNPFVCQWWAIDSDDRMILYRELYLSHGLVEDHAQFIAKHSQGETYEATVCDHDAEGRATLERYGIETILAKKSLRSGIQSVTRRLKKEADGKPRLMLMQDCLIQTDHRLAEKQKPTSTCQEFPGYIWHRGTDVSEMPVMVNDHGMDAMRYAVVYLDGLTQNTLDVRVLGK
ncbi:MAG: phage terminase large subunit [Phycisphaeraceae bacterium]|nr:phage terminase large subunit [Phycisphaeraceae bacterium]